MGRLSLVWGIIILVSGFVVWIPLLMIFPFPTGLTLGIIIPIVMIVIGSLQIRKYNKDR